MEGRFREGPRALEGGIVAVSRFCINEVPFTTEGVIGQVRFRQKIGFIKYLYRHFNHTPPRS